MNIWLVVLIILIFGIILSFLFIRGATKNKIEFKNTNTVVSNSKQSSSTDPKIK